MTAGAVSAPLIIPIMHRETHRAKNLIDTNTPVSLQSDTPGVVIFFTLDGSRPVQDQRVSASSRKYSDPVLLPAGRVAVKAVAVHRDGRQSSTVTKVFSVQLIDKNQDEENFLQRDQQNDSSLQPPELRIMGKHSQSGPRFLSSKLGRGTIRDKGESGTIKEPEQRPPVLRKTEFLQCAQCLALRPSDPPSQFCPHCGASAPLTPAEGGKVVRCVSCHSVVPVNTHSCFICEAPTHLLLQDYQLCVCCGSGNPVDALSCLTCESHLQQVRVADSAPSVPSTKSRKWSCSRCKRFNQSDARFCDWCGLKSGRVVDRVVCWRCGASGHPYTLHCSACGVFLEAPSKSSSDITQPAGGAAPNQASEDLSHDATRQKTKLTTTTTEQSTQTVGLYYPSATELQRREQQRAQQLSRRPESRERQPPLSNTSPGRGYWRQQLDHVCAHLRSYAQNNAPFRTLLGEPRLGRVVSAVVHEDPCEVSLSVSFVSARSRDQTQVDAADQTLSSVTQRHTGGVWPTGVLKQAPPTTQVTAASTVHLLQELGPGRGRVGTVQKLLDLGADPTCFGADGRHALAVAVMNRHHDVLPVLVQRGADVDQRSGKIRNSALHEAAALGSEGLRCAQVLLSCRAGVRLRNADGHTAYELAVMTGCSDMEALLRPHDLPEQ